MSGFIKYFFIPFVLLCAVVVAIAGKRGDISRKPPIEIFPDMDRQPKLRPQAPNSFFDNGITSQLPPPGTVAHTSYRMVGTERIYPHSEHPYNTGREAGSTNFVEVSPVPVTQALLERGRERYSISCAPCHGALGDGNGITKKIGAMAIVANLHDPRIVRQTDGEIFQVITHGKGLMGAYASTVTVEDRWAIISYLRALQLARLGSVDDLSPDARKSLPSAPPAGAKTAAAEKN